MIRKVVIMMLMLAAVSVTAMSVMSYKTPLRGGPFWLNDRDVVLIRCEGGHAILIWLRAGQGGKSLSFSHRDDDCTGLVVRGTSFVHIDRIDPHYVPEVRWRSKVPTIPPTRLTDIQVWAWMVVAAFAAYPTFAFFRGPLRRHRRRRRGLCLRCAYNLEGNVSGVCPECGEAT